MVDLNDGVDCTLIKFGDDTDFIYHELGSGKLGAVADTPDACRGREEPHET